MDYIIIFNITYYYIINNFNLDNQFLQAFMLTFRCFMTTAELLELITNQYIKKVKEVNNNNQSPLYFR